MPTNEPKQQIVINAPAWSMFAAALVFAVSCVVGFFVVNEYSTAVPPLPTMPVAPAQEVEVKPEPPPKLIAQVAKRDGKSLSAEESKALFDLADGPDGFCEVIRFYEGKNEIIRQITIGAAKPPVVDPVKPMEPVKPVEPPKPTQPELIPPGQMRVIIVHETTSKLNRDQQSILTNSEIRTYLKAKCAKDSKGQSEFRFYERDQQFAIDSQPWKDIWTSVKPEFADGPAVQLVIYDGTDATIQTVANVAEAMAALKKRGGE